MVKTPSRQTGLNSYNKALESLKTAVNYLLGERSNGKAVFYHIKSCNVEEIIEHVITFKAANFTRKMSKLRNTPNRSKLEQSELHKEVKAFLKSKCLHDGGGELKTDKEVDEHGEKFVLAHNEIMESTTESVDKDRGSNTNLTSDLNLETTTPVKEIGTEQLKAATDNAAIVRENDDQVIKKLQQQEEKSGSSLFESELNEQINIMEPLPVENTFSKVQSPTTSTASALTSATAVSMPLTPKNKSTVNDNKVPVHDNSEINTVGEENEKGSMNSTENKGVNNQNDFISGNAKQVPTSLNRKSSITGNVKLVPNSFNLTEEEDTKSRDEVSDKVAALKLKKKQILIDSLKDKNVTVASVLSTLMKSSKEVIDEVKFSELQSSSTVRLNRDDLLEGETFTTDYSKFHGLIIETAGAVETQMDEIIKVLIIDACNCVQRESKERQHNALLEAMNNHDASSKIGDATSEALEKEDRVKAATLENIIDTKMSGVARRFFSEATLQMSKLVKKAIETEKRPLEKVRYQAQQFDKRLRKKAKRRDERQRKHPQEAPIPDRNATATVNNSGRMRNDPSSVRGIPRRFYHAKERHLDGNRGRGRGGTLNLIAGRDNMQRSGTNARQIIHRPHWQVTGNRTGNFHAAPFRGGRRNQMQSVRMNRDSDQRQRTFDRNQRQRNVDVNQGQRGAGGGRGGGWVPNPNPTRK